MKLSLVANDVELLPCEPKDRRVARGAAMAAVIHALILVVALAGRSSQGDAEADTRATIATYMAASEARAALEAEASHAIDRGAEAPPAMVGLPAGTRNVQYAPIVKHPRPVEPRDDPSHFGLLAVLAADRHRPARSRFADFELPGDLAKH
jgi:hypothetical protein